MPQDHLPWQHHDSASTDSRHLYCCRVWICHKGIVWEMQKETSPSYQRAQLDFRNRVNITSETFAAIMKDRFRTSARRWPCHPYPLPANAWCFVPLRIWLLRIWSAGVRRLRKGWHSPCLFLKYICLFIMLYVVISDTKLHFFDDISKENQHFFDVTIC